MVFEVLDLYRSPSQTAPEFHADRLKMVQDELGLSSPNNRALADLTWTLAQVRSGLALDEYAAVVIANVVGQMFLVTAESTLPLPHEVRAYLERGAADTANDDDDLFFDADPVLSEADQRVIETVADFSPLECLTAVRLASAALSMHKQARVPLPEALRIVGLISR